MNSFFKNTPPGGQLLALSLAFVIFFILGTGVAYAPLLFGYDASNLASHALSQIVVFACSALLFCFLFYDSLASHLKLGMPSNMSKVFLGTPLVLLLALPSTDYLTTFNESLHLPQAFASLEQLLRETGVASKKVMEGFLLRDSVGDLLANIVVLALLPAVCEELFFRGALQQVLANCFRGKHHAAIWLTAAVFSLMHGELFAFLPRLFLGLLLGYLFYYGRSLWVNVVAHFLNNTIVVVLYFLAARGVIDVDKAVSFGFPLVVVLASFVAFVAVFYFVFVKKSKKNCL